jgi:hypothetical protein
MRAVGVSLDEQGQHQRILGRENRWITRRSVMRPSSEAVEPTYHRIGIVSLVSPERRARKVNVDHPRSRVADAEGQFAPTGSSILIADS